MDTERKFLLDSRVKYLELSFVTEEVSELAVTLHYQSEVEELS
jgi:hypothetical protein